MTKKDTIGIVAERITNKSLRGSGRRKKGGEGRNVRITAKRTKQENNTLKIRE